MKNILSKLAKPLLIPVLALSMNLKNADAQKLEFNPVISAGGKFTNHAGLKVYDDWHKHFLNLRGDEELKYKKVGYYFDSQVGVDVGLAFKNFSVGLTSRYYITDLKKERTLSAVELHNWYFNYARIHEFSLKQKTPSIGIYVNLPRDEHNRISLKGSVRNVDISEVKREDINLVPKSKCEEPADDTNGLTKEFERNKCRTLLSKIGLELQKTDDVTGGIELYYETDWKKIHELGANLSIYFNLPEKKKSKK
jgi:hypothetical protein